MITPGSILIKAGTPLPEPLRLGNDALAKGWASVSNPLDSHELEHQLSTGGWNFFYRAGALRTTAFSFDSGQDDPRGLDAAAHQRKAASLQLPGDRRHKHSLLPGDAVGERIGPFAKYSTGHAIRVYHVNLAHQNSLRN
jgi:hypothetical protein